MPDHEFEKNIQDKMAEFRLPPSEPVWDKVEQQLNKKDKRRRGLLWLPFLLAAAAGIYFINDWRVSSKADQQIISQPIPRASSAQVDKKIRESIGMLPTNIAGMKLLVLKQWISGCMAMPNSLQKMWNLMAVNWLRFPTDIVWKPL